MLPNKGLRSDTSQLGLPRSGSLPAFNLGGFGEAGQHWLAELKPDPLGGAGFAMRALASLGILIVTYLTLAALVHSWILPVGVPRDFFPREGDTFLDESSGEKATVVKREAGMSWIRATVAPSGSGPPAHVHTGFDERIVLVEGRTTAVIQGTEVHFEPGDTMHFPRGATHRFFNGTRETATIEHPPESEEAFPDTLVLCLSQIWGMTNDQRFLARRSMLLQMSVWAPFCDTWDSEAPIWLQKAAFLLIAPTARLLGYRPAYAAYVPHDL
jgi:mannose-6-phosphate isomerase-like protein (cupin superfamily)